MGRKLISVVDFKHGQECDLKEVFTSSVHRVCVNDYSTEQIQAWAPSEYDVDAWNKRIWEMKPYVGIKNSTVVGYADLQKDGYMDQFYVHGDCQGCGVGSALMTRILEEAKLVKQLYSHVSITAKSFFESYGFDVVEERVVDIEGVKLTNYLMVKNIESR